MRKTRQAVRISLISNQGKHLQLHMAFLCFTKKSDKAVSLLHCHRSPCGRFYSFLHSQGISSPGISSPSTSWKDTRMQTHIPTWKLAQKTCNIGHHKNCFLLKLSVISKPKSRQRRKEGDTSAWTASYICA